MTQGDRRGGDRVPVGLRVRLRYATVEEMVEKFAINVSRGGFFVPTHHASPVGTEIAFELSLSGGQRVVRGRGVVRWASAAGAGAAPGMGIQFTALDAPSRALVERMVAARARLAQGPAAGTPPKGPPAPPGPPRPTPTPRPPTSTATATPTATPTPTPTRPPTPIPAAAPASSSIPTLTPTPATTPAARSIPTLTLTPSPASRPAAAATGTPAPGPAQADLALPHRVQQLAAGPLGLDLGLPSEPPPVTTRSRAVIGIDLGTTNSCAAVVKDGKPYVIPSREGYNTVPSIVAVNARHKVVVGHLAKAQLLSNPRDTVYGSKRLLGRPFHSRAVRQIREAIAYQVVEAEDGLAAVELAGQRVALEQVAALILKEVKEVAQNHLGEEVNRAVITVPAYYNERQREAVRRAGALAGLHVERIVNEPTAAALAYAYGRGLRQRVLVYDLGGGTFDASVLELQDNVYEVVSTGGDTFLGGVDFDARITDRLLELYAAQLGVPFDGDRVALSRLVDAAERAKCALSERQEFPIQIPFLAMRDGEPLSLDATLSRAEISRLVEPLVERTLDVCREVLAAKGLSPDDLDEIILVGGQSRMPLVHERVLAFFGKAASRAVHPDEAVAIGAALLAHSLGRPDGVVLIDVLPIALGIATPEGRVRTVFPRNTPLPSRKSYGLSTTEDGQTRFELVVVQGDAERADDCEYLGTLRLDGLPPGPRGMIKISVGFELGAECLLTVTARELQTNRSVKVAFSAGKRAAPTQPRPADGVPSLVTGDHPLPGAPAPAPPRRGVLEFLRRLLAREVR